MHNYPGAWVSRGGTDANVSVHIPTPQTKADSARAEEVLSVRGLLIERDRGTYTKVECGLRSVISEAHAERLVVKHTGCGLRDWMAEGAA